MRRHCLDAASLFREDTLAEYAGALLLVTHDDALARRVTTTRWAIEDGRVTIASEPAT